MCLIVNKADKNGKIAECDLIVYKEHGRTKLFGLAFQPGYQKNFWYWLNKITKRVIITVIHDRFFCKIYEGYHFYTAEYIRKNKIKRTVYKFIIPKGTKFYENKQYDYVNEICAEQAKYVGWINTNKV